MSRVFVSITDYVEIEKLKQSLEDHNILYSHLSDYDRSYALDCIESFMHYWNKLKTYPTNKHFNDICMSAYKKLQNVNLISY